MGGVDDVRVKGTFKIFRLRVKYEELCSITFSLGQDRHVSSSFTESHRDLHPVSPLLTAGHKMMDQGDVSTRADSPF